MTTDLLFTPTPPQKSPSAVQPDESGIVSPEPSSKNAMPDSATGAEHETFLTTLRNVSQERNRSEKTQIDDNETPPNDETQPAANLSQLMALLEESGKAREDLLALKQLLGTIQSNGLRLGHEIAPGLERLRQLIARAMGVDPFGYDDSGLKSGFNPAQQNTVMISSAVPGEGVGVEKPAEILATSPGASSDDDSASKASKALKPVNGDESELAGKAGDAKNNRDSTPLPSTADKKPGLGGEPLVENRLTGQSSPVSKSINDTEVEKENPLKANLAAGDDLGSKVVKLEAGSNDSGQLAPQSQTFEKTLESTSLTKGAEASPREPHPQTMKQIVRRAVIQVRNGRHEARIDLKPDFMGQVRMQVSTTNQQVTVKILTEFGFVKDMIENNIQQLKAELQQQGLEIESVGVSVSRDAESNKHPQGNRGHTGSRQRTADANDRVNKGEGAPERVNRSFLRAEGQTSVDYFA